MIRSSQQDYFNKKIALIFHYVNLTSLDIV